MKKILFLLFALVIVNVTVKAAPPLREGATFYKEMKKSTLTLKIHLFNTLTNTELTSFDQDVNSTSLVVALNVQISLDIALHDKAVYLIETDHNITQNADLNILLSWGANGVNDGDEIRISGTYVLD